MTPLLFSLPGLLIATAVLDDENHRALLTVAEKSDFKATARYEEVVALLDRVAAASPLVRRGDLGRTHEGRDIPLVLIADPPVSTPEDAARQIGAGKLLVLAIGNIHAGEVDGKEALPMIARELITASNHPLLRDLIVALAPIYNADGNERVSRTNRPGQNGPEEGMGQRHNAQDLDLNRDFIKLEAPETRGLIDFLNRWDPAVFIDTHTTNGCYHRYIITFEGPKTPAGHPDVIQFVRDTMLPDIARTAREKYGVASFFYGDFNRDHTKWETYPCWPRYGTSYVGLRNRISILSEGYSYAPYKDRVLGTRDFVKACLEYAAANKDKIRRLLRRADAETIVTGKDPKPHHSVTLRTRNIAAPRKMTAAGFVEEQRDGRSVCTETPCDYEIEVWHCYESVLSVRPPFAYLLPPSLTGIAEKLAQHGIEFDALAADADLQVETYRVDAIHRAAQAFQNHQTVTLEVTPRTERRPIPEGTIVVRTAQKLGSLAAFLLEPQSEDGLATWNFFDVHMTAGGDFPVQRVPHVTDLPTRPLKTSPIQDPGPK